MDKLNKDILKKGKLYVGKNLMFLAGFNFIIYGKERIESCFAPRYLKTLHAFQPGSYEDLRFLRSEIPDLKFEFPMTAQTSIVDFRVPVVSDRVGVPPYKLRPVLGCLDQDESYIYRLMERRRFKEVVLMDLRLHPILINLKGFLYQDTPKSPIIICKRKKKPNEQILKKEVKAMVMPYER